MKRYSIIAKYTTSILVGIVVLIYGVYSRNLSTTTIIISMIGYTVYMVIQILRLIDEINAFDRRFKMLVVSDVIECQNETIGDVLHRFKQSDKYDKNAEYAISIDQSNRSVTISAIVPIKQ